MHSSPFIQHFLIGICALPPDAPPVAALAAEGLMGVHDFLMYDEREYDGYQYNIYDPDGRVTTYMLDANYCHLLRSLRKWLSQLVLENGPAILRDFGNRKFCRNHFESFLHKAQTIRALPTFHFPILDILPSRVIDTYTTCRPILSHAAGLDIYAICPEGEELDLLPIVGLVDIEVTAPSTLCTGSTVIIDSPARVTNNCLCLVTLTVGTPPIQQEPLSKTELRLLPESLSVPLYGRLSGPFNKYYACKHDSTGTVCVNVTFLVPRLDPVPGLLWVINTLDKWPHVYCQYHPVPT